MSAFLSHSSKDKPFVGSVAAALGALQFELDEATFEYTLNVQAIRNAVSRADLAVFFLSENSISSSFVKEEQRQILEALGRGTIKRVVIFAIDSTSYRALPDWLRDFNVVQQVTSPKACARRIQAMLTEIDLENEPEILYLGRDEDEKLLRKALRVSGADTPVALHIVGFHGIGRRTFVRRTLSKLFPRLYSAFITETVAANQSIDDLYRALYRTTRVSSIQDQVEDFTRFSNQDADEKARLVSEILSEMAENGEMLIVLDEGNGVFDDSGALFPHWKDILEHISNMDRPIISFIQTRMQPYRLRGSQSLSYHQRLDAIKSEDAKEIIGFTLKQLGVEFTDEQLDQLSEISGGHPFNIRFAAGLAQHYGVEPFLQDPSLYIAWRDKRGEAFLSEITFSAIEEEIVACLVDYRYLATDAMLELIDASLEETSEALRNLQDFCCLEFRDGMFHLANPIREAARRDERFQRDASWHRAAASKIVRAIEVYSSEDQVPLGLLETATMAAVRGDGAPDYVRALILPSHLLVMAREHYDGGRRAQCIDLCKQAYSFKATMTIDAQVEALRLWALSAARLKNDPEFNQAVGHLQSYRRPVSERVLAFSQGLKARLEHRDDDAESFFKKAWGFSKTNASINRELAKIYSGQRRYIEAEKYARQAYSTSPTNPYILDIMLEVLLGKRAQGMSVDADELVEITTSLERYGNEPGLSFYPVREAQRFLSQRDYSRAISSANTAIRMTPKLAAPYFIRFEAELKSGSLKIAERTLEELTALLDDIDGSDGEASKLAECQVQLLIERGQFGPAKERAEADRRIPKATREHLFTAIARAIAFEPRNVPSDLKAWAHRRGG